MPEPPIPNEHKLLLICSRITQIDRKADRVRALLKQPIDWDKTFQLAVQQNVFLFLYHALNKLSLQDAVPGNIYEQLRLNHFSSIKRHLQLEHEVLRVFKEAEKEHLGALPFKGFALTYTVYPYPGSRMMDDVDILVKKDHVTKFSDILYRSGYKSSSKNPDPAGLSVPFDWLFTKPPSINIEIHRALAPDRPNKINLPIWERTKPITINGQPILSLSPEDTFFSLVLHLRRHTRRLTLKFVADIAGSLDVFGPELDWDYIQQQAKQNRIRRTVYLALYLSKELLEAPVPEDIYKEFCPEPLTKFLIHSVINKISFFSWAKWRGTWLRILLFDSPIDLLLYSWRVSFLERLLRKPHHSKSKNMPNPPDKRINT